MTNRMIHHPSYLGTADIGAYWTSSGLMAISAAKYLAAGSSGEGSLNKVFDSQSGWTVGGLFTVTASFATTDAVFAWSDSGLAHCELRFNGTFFTVTRNGTLIQTGTTPISLGVSYYIEWQVVINDTGTSILKINGVTDSGINSTSVDTRNGGGTATANTLGIVLSRSNRAAWTLAHLYVNDNAGGVDDTFWGPITVATLAVTAAGNSAGMTPSAGSNYQNVDEATMNGDTDYNSATTVVTDTFTASDTGYATGTIKGVEWVAEARLVTASGTARLAPVFRISGTDYVGSDLVPALSYLILSARYRVSPATSAAWGISELNGAEIGIKRTVV